MVPVELFWGLIMLFVFKLLKQEEIKRMGAGGRRDPYIYTITSMKQQQVRPGESRSDLQT